MLDTRLTMLRQDDYRQHFIVSRELKDIEAILVHRPDLLVEPFADGGTPLSVAIKRSSVRQKALIELILSHEPDIGLYDLMGIGRCDEFLAAVAADPGLANQPRSGRRDAALAGADGERQGTRRPLRPRASGGGRTTDKQFVLLPAAGGDLL